MDASERRRELGRFLRDRRARLSPEDVGLSSGGRRRVTGLRREEVADIAGVGVSWYTMLESGTATGVSAATLDAVARALRLTSAEITFILRLAEQRAADRPRDELSLITRTALEAIEWVPAYVVTSQWLVLAWNRAMSVVWGIEAPGGAPFNIVERTFRDEAFRKMHGDRFPEFACNLVSMVRSATASHLENLKYRAMCDDLQSDPIFAEAWKNYDVFTPVSPFGTTVESAATGVFTYEAITLEVSGDDGHWLVMQVPDESSGGRLRSALGSDNAHAGPMLT